MPTRTARRRAPSRRPRQLDVEAVTERIVTRAQRAMLADRRSGVIPAVRSFSKLHDFVDANLYLLNKHGEFDSDVMAFGVPEVRGQKVEVPSDAINVDELLVPYNRAQKILVRWIRDGALLGIDAPRKPNRGPMPDATVQWPSKETGLTYRMTPTPDGVRTEVFWADKFRGIRAQGRSVYDRLARSVHEALAKNEASARAMTRAFDEAFLHAVNTKYNGRKSTRAKR